MVTVLLNRSIYNPDVYFTCRACCNSMQGFGKSILECVLCKLNMSLCCIVCHCVILLLTAWHCMYCMSLCHAKISRLYWYRINRVLCQIQIYTMLNLYGTIIYKYVLLLVPFSVIILQFINVILFACVPKPSSIHRIWMINRDRNLHYILAFGTRISDVRWIRHVIDDVHKRIYVVVMVSRAHA